MKYISLFSGIGGFELGIQRAYESNNEHAHVGEESEQEERAQGRERSAHKLGALLHAGDGPAPLRPYNGAELSKGDTPMRNSDDAPDEFLGKSVPVCVGFSEIDKYAIRIYQSHFPEHHNYGDITKIEEESLPDFDLLVGGFPCQSFSIAGKRRGFADTRGTLFFDIARIIKAKRPRLLLLENVKGLLSHDGGATFKIIIATLDELGYDLQWQVVNSKAYVPQNRERVYIVGHIRGTRRPEVFPLHYAPDGISPALNTMQGGNRQPFVALGRDGADTGEKADSDGMREASRIPRRLDGVGTSDSQRYKCCGNAVTTYCVEAIMKKILA